MKQQGLAFGRNLQMVLKSAAMYSVDHPAIEKSLQQAFTGLIALIKLSGQFTIGFVNHRLLVGNILTDDESLQQLEAEFGRRGIGTVTFSAGITQREFKRALAVLSTRPQTIDEAGGIQKFLGRIPVNGLRILPASKPSGEDEDVRLRMDAASFDLVQKILSPATGGGSAQGGQGLSVLCQIAGVEQPSRAPGGEAVFDLAGRAVQSALIDREKDPRDVRQALALWLEEMTPSAFLSALPAEQQRDFQGRLPEEIATEVVEDAAARWGARRLVARSTEGTDEEETAQLLMRGLRATQVAERLLRKLARFLDEAGLPAEVFERQREAMAWYSLPPEQQRERLMQLQRFTDPEFHRLVNYARERMDQGQPADALEIAAHYFACLFAASLEVQAAEFGRAAQLLGAVAGQPSLEFLRTVANRICKELAAHPENATHHAQAVACLAQLAQMLSRFEDFETVHRIGLVLEELSEPDIGRHSACCAVALEGLLSPSAIERLLELFLANREGAAAARIYPALLRWLGTAAAEKVLARLEEESNAANRMRLIRLTTQLGPAGSEAAKRRLADPRWYVVRNACRIIGDLEETRLHVKLRAALLHADPRVQQEAASAILRSTAPERASFLAESLGSLHGPVLDQVLDELLLLKDPSSVEGLARLLLEPGEHKLFTLEKAVRILSVISTDEALEALGRVLSHASVPPAIRKAARDALTRNASPAATRLLAAAPSAE